MLYTNFIGENRDIRTNQLLRWRLTDTSGDALDSSGNGHDGTVVGATQSATGVTLDGVNDEITNTDSTFTTPMTDISNWTIYVRTSKSSFTADDGVASLGESNANDAWSMNAYESASGNGCQIWYDGAVIITGAGTAPADDTDHDFVFRQSGATASEVFVDKVSEATDATSKATAATMDGFTLGRYIGNGEWYPGVVKEVIIYDRALTNNQIRFLTERYV